MITDSRLDELLREDAPHGDLTTDSLGIGSLPGRIEYTAREPLVLAGVEEAARLLARVGCSAQRRQPSGTSLSPGALILEAEGPAAAIHLGWKVALHLLEQLSGIATRTRLIVDAARAGARGREVPVAATRKGFPGTRDLALLGVRAGGGIAHRLGLSDSILIFAQHRVFLGADGLQEAAARIRRREPERKVVVEVSNLDDALEAVRSGADVIQVEKLAPDAFAKVVAACPGTIVAATGGIDESNAAAYGAAGAALIVTSAPFAARPAEIRATVTAG